MDYQKYVPEGCQKANDQFIREFMDWSYRYFAWLRTQSKVNRDECRRVMTRKIQSILGLDEE